MDLSQADSSDVPEDPADIETFPDVWFYPEQLRDGLEVPDLSEETIQEALACAYEYARSVIPEWKDNAKYMAFTKTIVIAVVAEFRGDLVPQDGSSIVLGYDLEGLLDSLFGSDTELRAAMSREFRAFLLLSVEKSSKRLDSELFRRYLCALTESPQTWFRLRDCDALVRYTIASALSCNECVDVIFSEEQWRLIGELCCTLYDAVAFHKHRAEGETNSTFGYFDAHTRVKSFQLYRMVLWAIDVPWATNPAKRCVVNFLRFFGGPLHMMTRRYRFVEDGLRIGKPETEQVVELTRANFKLWNRVEETAAQLKYDGRYADFVAQSDKLMFDGFCDLLQRSGSRECVNCTFIVTGTTKDIRQFGGIQLCRPCKEKWGLSMAEFPERFKTAFPETQNEITKLIKGLWQIQGGIALNFAATRAIRIGKGLDMSLNISSH
ncbi:uncharacterized protein F5Z01DRAFT_668409 [Emericellopsis atlantica]|uniref:Uncharacterized protein n=1 Tax=Emericellopsis atlantica TaxID=2614577 RepID=A0A9P8CJR2_9HYPO|nr:uncharacterized protein F5Z01DRAFT_668409 [Emericellopsis atlantica]KAG9249734.1 hypothetical protein F5Z01DRAFT_668409 [Emericellopsis atlantica]